MKKRSRTEGPQLPDGPLTGFDGGISPEKFYKKGSQEKNLPGGWNLACFAAHLNEQDLF